MIISLNLSSLELAERRLRQRTDDLRYAAQRVHGARDNLQIHDDDPNVRGIHNRLDIIRREIEHVALRVDDDARQIKSFRQRAEALDGGRGRVGVGLAALTMARRLIPATRAVARRVGRSLNTLRQGLLSVGRSAMRTVRAVLRPGVKLFRAAQRFTSRSVATVRSTYQRAKQAVGDRLRQIKNWATRKWRQVTGFFKAAWDRAWAVFQTIAQGLRAAVRVIRDATVRTVKAVGRVVRVAYDTLIWLKNAIFSTRFTEPPQPWSENVVSEQDFKGEVQINIPMKQFGFDIRLQPSVHAQVKTFDDGSKEVTLGAEFAAGIAAEVKMKNPGVAEAEIEAAVMAALGGERTYRLAAGSDVAAFIAQQVTRAILQGVKVSGGAQGAAAGLMLRAMPPAPEPVSSSLYMKVGAELNASISVGNTGVSGKVEGEIEFRSTVGRDGSAELEGSFKVAAEAAASMGLTGPIQDGVKHSAEASGSVKLICGPDGLPSAVELSISVETRVGAEGKAESKPLGVEGSTEVGTAQRQTSTTRVEIQPADRAEISAIMKRMPSSAGELMSKVAQLTARGKTEVATESYDYAAGKVEVGADPVKATFSTETRTNYERTVN